MRGEAIESAEVTRRGLEGDRQFGVLDAASGTIVSAKKDGRLLEARAFLAGVELTIRLPTGETALGVGAGVDAALSAWLARPVHLVAARPEGRGTYEMPADFEDDDSPPVRWEGPRGSFADASPVHLLTTATLRALRAERGDLQWDVARFRPNVLVEAEGDTCVEDTWIGRRVRLGEVELEVRRPCARCVMTTRAQPGGLDRQLDVLRHINSAHAGNIGVLARVVTEGRLEVGMPVTLR